jgi:hypothetical protein
VLARQPAQRVRRQERAVHERLVEEVAALFQQAAGVGRFEDQLVVRRAEALGHGLRERALVVAGLGKAEAERLEQAAGPVPARERQDGGGIDAAAQKEADRHVGGEPTPDGGRELRDDPLAPLGLAHGGIRREAHIPVAGDARRLPGADRQRVPRRKLGDAGNHRQRIRHVLEGQIGGERVEIEVARHRRMRQQRAKLRAEDQRGGRGRVVDRLFAHAVTRQKELAALRVPDREREHPVQPLHALLAPLLPGVHEDFRVAMRAETMATTLQLRTQIGVVVDLSVERRPDGARLVGDGLITRVEVDDAEAPDAEREAAVEMETLGVRPAMSQLIRHTLDERALPLQRALREKAG